MPAVRHVMSVLVGLTLLVGPPVAWQASRPPATVGEVPTQVAPEPTRSYARPATDLVPPPALALPGVEVRTGTLEELELLAAPPPVRIRIPAIGVDAEVVAVGQSAPGVMEIPSDVDTVGWYEPGVTPGRRGSAVLSGHVDSRTQGRGAFFDLRRLDVDDTIELVDADGQVQRWNVVARTSFPKEELADQGLFSRDGEPRLVLITCGGAFDAAAGRYTDNVAVHAVPV